MYEREMRKCFKLAARGMGMTSPNPLVGCVVLDKTGNEISNGYHHFFGSNHAERDALTKITPQQAQGGTLVVNLEPCNHYGKTPPCSDLIIKYGIKQVIIANLDPNPIAAGGVQKLRNSGVKVITGVLEEEGKLLNRIFFFNVKKQRPYIVTKIATTIDGKISTCTGDSKWITSDKARQKVKNFRQKYDAILTTSSTIIADNPQMKHKLKIILDRKCKLNFNSRIFQTGEIILVSAQTPPHRLPPHIRVINVSEYGGKLNLDELFDKLYQLGIRSIFVEAGSKLNGDLMKHDLVNEIIHFTAPKILNDNSGKSCFDGDCTDLISNAKLFKIIEIKSITPDYYVRYIKVGAEKSIN